MGQPLMDLHGFVFLHWVSEMLGSSRKNLEKIYQFVQCCLHIALLLWHPTHYTKPKKQNKQKQSMEVHDWFRHRVCFLCFFLYSELDAKAEEQCADSIEEIDRFSRVFPTSAQHFQNAMEIKTNQWRSMSG